MIVISETHCSSSSDFTTWNSWPAGTFSISGSSCTNCPDNTYSETNASNWILWSTGFYSVSGEPVWHTIWGDGLRVGSEQWDDGNANPNDGCSNLCTIETGYVCQGGTNHSPDKWDIVWGDWIIISPETWDDWNRYSGDGWSATCQLESVKKFSLMTNFDFLCFFSLINLI